jgi:hypothetical protein
VEKRTPVQWYCLVFGAVLVLVGILGFLVDSSFDTGSSISGDKLLGIFEVNGSHNLVHIGSGALLLGMAGGRLSARITGIGFGVVYGAVAIIGLIDGRDVLTLLPVNAPDNVLHIIISALGIIAGIVSTSSYDDRPAPGAEPVARG